MPCCCGLPPRHSFTGEDVAEFHIHGGRAVREALFAALSALGARMAEPGEFSRRAVENGKLDLTRAEAVADLVDAETPAQLRQALRQHDGVLADLYEGWRARLIAALGRAEAAIDFSDDGVGESEFAAARRAAAEIAEEIQEHVDDAGPGRKPARGPAADHSGAAQCRQILADQCSGAARRGHRFRDAGHNKRCDRSQARSGRVFAASWPILRGCGRRGMPSRRKACAALCLMLRAD